MRYQQPKEPYEYTKTRIIHEHFNTEPHIVGASPRTSMQILKGPSLSTPETIQDILLKWNSLVPIILSYLDYEYTFKFLQSFLKN